MKVFEFPLQAALKMRERTEDAVRRKFASVQRQCAEAESHLHHYQKLLAMAEQTARSVGDQSMDIHTLVNCDGYRQRMSRMIQDQEELCQEFRQEVSDARRALMEACRARQTLQILRENQYQNYLGQVARLESRALDQIGTLAYNHNEDGLLAGNFKRIRPLEAS